MTHGTRMVSLTIELKNIRSDIANVSKAIQFVYQSDKRLCLLRLGLIFIQSILPVASLYLLKLIIDAITTPGNQVNIWLYVTLFCGIFLASRLSNVISQFSGDIQTQKLTDYISSVLHEKSISLDLTYYDNPEYHDTFHRAQQEASYRPIFILNNITDLLKNSISFVGVAYILTSLSWGVVLIMVLAGLPTLLVKLSKIKTFYIWQKSRTSLYRKANYYSMLITHRNFAKEIRIYRLGIYLCLKFQKIRVKLVQEQTRLSKQRIKSELFSSTFEVVLLAVIIILLTKKAFTGAITVGSFAIFFEAFRRGLDFWQGILISISGLYNNKLFLANLFMFLKLQPIIKQIENPLLMPKLKQGIQFQDVTFQYEGGRKVLRDVTFSVKPGEIILITGENGSGKTTLIKLLCRMYECTKGTITFDGIDIKDLEIKSLYKNIGIIFQDFGKYDITVSDNIKFGEIEFERPVTSVSEIAGAHEFIEQLPKKYDTVLGKYFHEGEELSIGQWQKIALARALYNDAQILILDEPTSSVDKETEDLFFNKLRQLGKDKIIIVIGHKITDNVKADHYFHLHKGKFERMKKTLSKEEPISIFE